MIDHTDPSVPVLLRQSFAFALSAAIKENVFPGYTSGHVQVNDFEVPASVMFQTDAYIKWRDEWLNTARTFKLPDVASLEHLALAPDAIHLTPDYLTFLTDRTPRTSERPAGAPRKPRTRKAKGAPPAPETAEPPADHSAA